MSSEKLTPERAVRRSSVTRTTKNVQVEASWPRTGVDWHDLPADIRNEVAHHMDVIADVLNPLVQR